MCIRDSVYRVLGASASALVNNDLAAMADLAQRDDEVHEVYERFFRCLLYTSRCV